MKNMDLNVGGLIGALLLGALGGLIGYLAMGDGENTRPISKLLIGGVVLGAIAGNQLWAKFFKNSE